MNVRTMIGLTAAFVIGCCVFLVSKANAQDGKPIDELAQGRPKWEYRVVIPNETGPDLHEQRRSNLENQLREIGQDGWELVVMYNLKGIRYNTMVFKRPAR